MPGTPPSLRGAALELCGVCGGSLAVPAVKEPDRKLASRHARSEESHCQCVKLMCVRVCVCRIVFLSSQYINGTQFPLLSFL